MQEQLERRIAVVTGAASGLGLAIAERLAKDGAHVIAVDRDPSIENVAERLRQSGGSAEAAIVDLSVEDEIFAFAQTVTKRHGRWDILVNNAGISPKIDGKRVTTETMPMAQWHDVIAVNLTAPLILCRQALPIMRARGFGRIINISSRAGRTLVGTAGTHYSATKAGLIGMSRAIAGEGAKDGITVNCIAPGRFSTPMTEQGSPEMLAALKAAIPVGRAGRPDELGAMVSYLASDAAGFVTGAVFDINGGSFMG
ncbi:MAG: SDR family oxidoreductase [Rhodobiaceae bacterium]|nr:SDR family oxidoreductase [Rhodobiaceae bacterium]MCC0054573.1 SDR family oxidoreductase [Rhodobiaceae bacterium]